MSQVMHLGIHAAERPEKIAYQMAASGESVSYKTLFEQSNRAANLFRSLGLVPLDGIAILLDNHVKYLQITWAAQRSGLYYTPISILFQKNEIEYIIDNSDAKVLISSKAYVSLLDLTAFSDLKIFLVDTMEAEAQAIGNQVFSLDHHLAAASGNAIIDECEGAEMIYSSGTTGLPKGVRFPLHQSPPGTVSDLFKTRVALHKVDTHTRYLSTAPLYHSAPLRYSMMVMRQGGSAVVMEKFDPEQALQLIEANQISHSQWVPTMFVRLLKLPIEVRDKYRVDSLAFAIHAAAPCPIEIKQQMIDWFGPIIYEYYSGTEANGSTAITSEEWLTHKGSVGRAIHGEIHILDDDECELATGEIGTVFFANGSDFSYYKDPEKTRAAQTQQGWSTLGDMGFVDAEGYLYLRDRKSFMIISGGVNIYPQEIENTLISHAKVADIAVFGVPNAEFGEEVKAVVQLMPDIQASNLDPESLEQDLKTYCRERISHVKCPRSIDFMEALPRHPTGKLYKRQLRDSYWPSNE